MLLNTIDTSSMHSISSLLDTITHLTPGTQPGETTRQRNADNGSLERERQREGERERAIRAYSYYPMEGRWNDGGEKSPAVQGPLKPLWAFHLILIFLL